jgi:hypothetical protein
MKLKLIEESFPYDGRQLKSLFAYMNYQLMGDSIVSWRGACDIPKEHMVDGEDLLANAEIRGADMVHFIIEKFEANLLSGVFMQRILASIVIDQLRSLSEESELTSNLRREGDDVFVDDRKFSISIATQSPTSTLVHFAVNVNNDNTPVSTISLEDFRVDPQSFALSVMEAFCNEVATSVEATQKVKWVQ